MRYTSNLKTCKIVSGKRKGKEKRELEKEINIKIKKFL